MAIIAKWKSKTWEVSNNKILTLSGFSTASKLKENINTSVENSPSSNERGKELEVITFESSLNAATGIAIRNEYEEWKALVGESSAFYLGGEKFGPVLKLTEVVLSDILFDDIGRMRTAMISYRFEESNVIEKEPALVESSAVNIGPSKSTKAELKPINSLIATSEKIGFAVGSNVSIVGIKYATGETIPSWVKSKKHTISSIKETKALLGSNGGINSWVYLEDLTLV